MTITRTVLPETLDGLAESDPAARRSRRDLRRVHAVMGTRRIVARGLRALLGSPPGGRPLRLLELGAGDGTLMLAVARDVGWQSEVELSLLDRLSLVEAETLDAYAALGWRAMPQRADALDWAREAEPAAQRQEHREPRAPARYDLIVANLFLHHFDGPALDALLGAVAASADRFFACEPRRSALALAGSHCVGALGANAVTREDAVLSVHAGFREAELTARWPRAGWELHEYAAGLFSHCFSAARPASAPPHPRS